MSSKVKIGIIQTKCSNNVTSNEKKFEEQVKNIASKGAQIICSQELYASEYFCFEENAKHYSLAVELNEDVIGKYSKLALQNNVVLIISLFEKRMKGVYHNTALIFDADGSYLGFYRKKHIPDDPGFYEKYYFTPGDDDYKVFDTKHGKIGTLICWDQWYPEAARLTALKGADIIFYPTAIGWDLNANAVTNQEEQNAWITMHKAHAIANGIHVVAINRVGEENGTKFWGNSLVSNPMGRTLFEASSVDECEEIIEIDIQTTEHYRQTWPFLRDRRIDSYQNITKRIDD